MTDFVLYAQIIGSCVGVWLTGFGVGKAHRFFNTVIKRATRSH